MSIPVLDPLSLPRLAVDPGSGSIGDTIYNTTEKTIKSHDGTGWKAPSAVSGNDLPVGAIVASARSAAPAGYLSCDGSAVSRTTYSDLYAAIGTAYGAGDGSTTFNLPDFRGRSPVGAGTGTGGGASGSGVVTGGTTLSARSVGAWGGEEIHALSVAEMPSHSHGVTDPQHNHGGPIALGPTTGHGAGSYTAWLAGTDGFTGAGANNGSYLPSGSTGISVNSTGSGTSHNTMHPFIVVNWLIKSFITIPASVTQESWHLVGAVGEPAFQNSWHNVGGSYEVAAFRLLLNNVVAMKGTVSGGTSVNQAIFTLPPAYRPAATRRIVSVGADNGGASFVGQITIDPTGVVSFYSLSAASTPIDEFNLEIQYAL